MQASQQHTSVIPVIGLLIAASFWGVFWYPLRILETYGLDGIWATLFIYTGTMIFAMPILFRRFGELRISPMLMIGILLFGGWTNAAFILALMDGEIVRVILLFYLSPIWATLLAKFILKEHLSRMAYVTIAIAIFGAMTMLWSPEVGYPWPASMADWLALSSGLAFALANVFTHMANKVSVQVKTSVTWVGVIVVAGIMILVIGDTNVAFQTEGVFKAFLLGALIMSFVTYCVVYGVTHMPVHRSAVILIFEVVAAAISSYLFTNERMSLLEWTGGSIVVFAAYLAALEHRRSAKSI